jgi:hypothetical protein
MYRAGSLRAVAVEILKYKLGLVGVQEVRWDKGDSKPEAEGVREQGAEENIWTEER